MSNENNNTILTHIKTVLQRIGAFFLFLGAWLFPLFAALGKSLGNTYGLTVVLFGVAILATGQLPLGLLFFSGLIAINLFLVSLNMEGRSVQSAWQEKAAAWWSHSVKEKQPVLRKVNTDKHIPNLLPSKQKMVCYYAKTLIACLMALLVAMTKGMCMAFGVISLLPLPVSSPGGIALMVVCAVVVGAASLCKEGRQWVERLQQCGPRVFSKKTTPKPTLSPKIAWPRFILSLSIPVLAAGVKSVGYTFGAVALLSLWGIPLPVLVLLGAMMAISLFTTALCMEGASICIAIQNRFCLSDLAIDKKLPGFHRVKWRCTSGLVGLVSVLSSAAKALAMMLGTLSLLTQWHLPFVGVLVLSIAAATGVAAVVLFKEGKHFFLLVNGCEPTSSTDTACITAGSLKPDITHIKHFVHHHISFNRDSLLETLQAEEASMLSK